MLFTSVNGKCSFILCVVVPCIVFIKYVYGVVGNTYKDASGRPTNGATTGCHLHIGFRLNEEYVNPLDYLQ